MIIFHFHLLPQYNYKLFHIYTSRHLTPRGRYELNKFTFLSICGFIAQLVEHRTGIAEVTSSNPFEAPIFFECQASFFQLFKLENLLRWSSFTFIYYRSTNMNYFIYTSRHFTPRGRNELDKLSLLPMCGFTAQLTKHRTGIAEVTGSNPVEALFFFQAFSFQFSKIVPKARLTFPNIFREFPKVSENVRRFPKTFEEDPKMFRWYTNELKLNLEDNLDISEFIDIFTCEDIISFLSICYFSAYHWFLYNKKTLHVRSRIWISYSSGKNNMFPPLEPKTHHVLAIV